MLAEIISIGNELISGITINTNASFISRKLEEIGIEVAWVTTVGDNERYIFEALEQAEKRADVIISTGGLGPTHDDVTKKVFAQYFDSKFVFNEAILEKLHERFRQRNLVMSKCNEQQAYVPEKAKIIQNAVGTAPGLLFERSKKLFFVLPGVPSEMETMMIREIIPFLKRRQKRFILNRVIHTCGIPESTLFARLGDVKELEKICKLAFLPHMGIVDIRLTAIAENQREAQQKIFKVEQMIKEKAGKFIWGYDEETFEKLIVRKLSEKNRELFLIEINTNGELLRNLLEANSSEAAIQGFVAKDVSRMERLVDFKIEELFLQKHFAALFQQLNRKFGADLFFITFLNPKTGILKCVFLGDESFLEHEEKFPHSSPYRVKRAVVSAMSFLNKCLNQKRERR